MPQENKLHSHASDNSVQSDDLTASHEELQEMHEDGKVAKEAQLNQIGSNPAPHRKLAIEDFFSETPINDLRWSDVLDLIERIGKITRHVDEEFTFEVRDERAAFKRPGTDDVPSYEIAELRRFLRKAAAASPREGQIDRTIVIIDHQAAHIYRRAPGAADSGKTNVEPYDPFGFHRHLIHRKEAHYQGERVPEEDFFYLEIGNDLVGSGEIVLVGHGKGKSNAAEVLLTHLKSHFPEVALRVVETEALDLSALTEPEIEQEVRKRLNR